MSTPKLPRLYYLDAMRSILMMLGVVLHAAAIYAVNADWVISDPVKSDVLDWVWQLIAQFRMPCFFIISGFFCYKTLHRYGTKQFLKLRMPRIVIPLLSTAIVFNSLQNFIVYKLYNETPWQISPIQYFIDGYWVSHLWFLNCLIIFFLMAASGYFFLAKPAQKIYEKITQKLPFISGGLYLFVLPLVTIVLNTLSYRIDSVFDTSGFFINIHEVFYFSGFFFFGYALSVHRSLFEEFSCLYLWIPVAVVMAFLGNMYLADQDGIFAKILNRYSTAFLPWGFAVMCFTFFRRFFDKPSAKFNYLADASYSIYLFHHFFVVVFGLIFLVFDWHAYIKFSLVVVLSMSLSFMLHHYLVLRFNLLSWLFNGKWLSERGRERGDSRDLLTSDSLKTNLKENTEKSNQDKNSIQSEKSASTKTGYFKNKILQPQTEATKT